MTVPPEPSSPAGPSAPSATAAPSLTGLGATLQRGAAISAVALVVTQVVSFVQTLAMARLLTPLEVGVFTAGTVLADFLSEFSEGGLRNALIQREEDLEDAADTVFWATFAAGVLMAGVAVLIAPVLGAFFHSDLTAAVTAVTAGTLVLHGLQNVPDGLMQRQFNFKRRLIIDPARVVVFAVVAVILGALGAGVWSLVAGLYASQLVTTVLLWVLSGWRPGRGRPSFRLWREMARFAFPLIVYGFSQKVRELAEAGLVGRVLGAGNLGVYRYGRRVAVLPGTAIVEVASYVLFPAFSRIASDPPRMRRAFLRATRVLWMAATPAAALLAAVGAPLVTLLLGAKWTAAGLVLVGTAGFGPGMALMAVGEEALKGSGHSRRLHWVTGCSIVVGLGSLALLLPVGLLGVGLAVSLGSLSAGALGLALALPVVSVRGREIASALVPPLVAAALAGGAVAALEHLVVHSQDHGVVAGLGLLAIEGVLFVALYLVLLRVLSPSLFSEVSRAAGRARSVAASVRSRLRRQEDDHS